jgi:hypothetical protein
MSSNPEHSTRLIGWRHKHLLVARLLSSSQYILRSLLTSLSFAYRPRQIRCLSIPPTPTPTPSQSKITVTDTVTIFTDTDTDTEFHTVWIRLEHEVVSTNVQSVHNVLHSSAIFILNLIDTWIAIDLDVDARRAGRRCGGGRGL